MTGFANRLQALGQKQSGRDLAWSSLAWSGLYYPDASTNMAFSTNAEPSVLVQQSTVWFQAAWTAWDMCADFVPRATFSSANKMLTLTWPIAWPGWTPFPANETVFVRNTDFSKSCASVCAEKGAAHEKLYPSGLSCPASYTYLSRASSFADLPRALRKFGRALPSFASGNQYSTPSDGPAFTDAQTGVFKALYLPKGSVTCNSISSYLSPTGRGGAAGLKKDTGIQFDVEAQICPCAANYTQPCAANFDIAQDFGYSIFTKGVSPGQFSVSFDVRSVFVATAVNYGIISLSDLQRVSYPFFDTILSTLLNKPDLPAAMFFVHPKFAPHTPVVCFDRGYIQVLRPDLPPGPDFSFCFAIDDSQMGQDVFIPAFPVATSGTWLEGSQTWTQCTCNEPSTPRTAAQQQHYDLLCNNLNVKIDLVFPRGVSGRPLYLNLIEFGVQMALMVATVPDADASIFTGMGLKANLNKFCPPSDVDGSPKCFSMTLGLLKNQLSNFLPINALGLDFSSLSPPGPSSTFSVKFLDQQLSFRRIACQNSLYNPAAVQRMIDNPPVSLLEPYYKCKATPAGAMLNAFGSAAGTSSLVVTLVMTVLLGAIVVSANYLRGGEAHRLRTVREAMEARMRDLDLKVQQQAVELARLSSPSSSSSAAAAAATAAATAPRWNENLTEFGHHHNPLLPRRPVSEGPGQGHGQGPGQGSSLPEGGAPRLTHGQALDGGVEMAGTRK